MDADDAVQETMFRAWRALHRFDGRAAPGTWLHRIATTVCLDALADRSLRLRPIEIGPAPSMTRSNSWATLAERGVTVPGERKSPSVLAGLSETQQALVERYVAAFEAYDVAAVAALMKEDATMNMPPCSLWLRRPDTIAQWLLGCACGCRGSRLVRTAASGMPAFGQSRDDGATPWALVLLDLDGDRIEGSTFVFDTETLFPRFGLPMQLPAPHR